MAAMSHAFKTEIETKSSGNPTFLSRHIDALVPPSQEEDEWLDQELERARLQRGNFYKKLANSRSASARELEDLAASRLRSASRGSTERELSLSPSGSTSSPPPAIPEPHSSWRFYTSFDNGEWKRHCVPVYKPEEEILMKSPSDSANKENSPAYESHLSKYRQARASLFDRPPSRRFAGASPREETTTVRIVSGGNDITGRGSSTRLPFGKIVPEFNVKTGGEVLCENRNGSASAPRSFREEITTSETITSVKDLSSSGQQSGQQAREKSQTPIVSKDPSPRPKHFNLGYKEKIIVPTKYKTDEEKQENSHMKENSLHSTVSPPVNKMPNEMTRKIKAEVEEPSFLGSTFEKFSFSGVPLVAPVEQQSDFSKPVFGGSHVNERNAAVNVVTTQQKPIFNSSLQFSNHHVIANVKPNIGDSGIEISSSFGSPFESSTPLKGNIVESSTRLEKQIGSPFSRVQEEHSIPVQFSHSTKGISIGEQDVKREAVCKVALQENPTFGNEFSAFSAPVSSKNTRQLISLPERRNDPPANIDSSSSMVSKKDGVIFIPVIRVLDPTIQERHTSELSSNVGVDEHALLNVVTERDSRLCGVPILQLEEDKNGHTHIVQEDKDWHTRRVQEDKGGHSHHTEEVTGYAPTCDKILIPTKLKNAFNTEQMSPAAVNVSQSLPSEKIIIPSKQKHTATVESNASANVANSMSSFDSRSPANFSQSFGIRSPSDICESLSARSPTTINENFSNSSPLREKIIVPTKLKNITVIAESKNSAQESKPNDSLDRNEHHVLQQVAGSPLLTQEPDESAPAKREKPVFHTVRNYKSAVEIVPERYPVSVEFVKSGGDSSSADSAADNAFQSIVKTRPGPRDSEGSLQSAFNSAKSPSHQVWHAELLKEQEAGVNLGNASAKIDKSMDNEYSFDVGDWVIERAIRL